MWWIVWIVIFVSILYLILILGFFIGWRKIPVFIPSENANLSVRVSVIIPCRNEEKNIDQLVSSISKQTYLNFELILVNDHSDDATLKQIKLAQQDQLEIKIIDATGFGKKNALREGILKSTGSLIITTDADCLNPINWIQTIVDFQSQNLCDLIICPMRMLSSESTFSKLQKLEFISLIASGAGASGIDMPILCNAANLAFTKKIWLENQANLHDEEQSGDDIFLLENVKKQGGNIKFLKSESAIVTTSASESLNEFIKQRRRWTSKSPVYTDFEIIATAVVVFAINLLLIVLIGLAFESVEYLILFLSLFVFKYFVDSVFLNAVRVFFEIKNLWFWSLLLSICYPLYIVFVALSTFIMKPKKWK